MKRFLLIILVFFSLPLWGDNTGILKSRLFDQGDGVYLLEVDVQKAQVTAIGDPVFPKGFIIKAKDSILLDEDLLTLRYWAESRQALTLDSQIILPWIVSGTYLSSFPKNGFMQQGLYLRSLGGITLPAGHLFASREEQNFSFSNGLHFLQGYREFLIPVLILALVLSSLFPLVFILKFLVFFLSGQFLGLIFSEVGIVFPSFLFSLILLLFLSFYLASLGERNRSKIFQIFGIALLSGFVFSSGLFQEMSLRFLIPDVRMKWVVFVLFTWTLILSFLSVLLSFCLHLFQSPLILHKAFHYTAATLSVFFLLLLFQNRVVTGNFPFMETRVTSNQSVYDLPDPGALKQTSSAPRALMTDIEMYLAVDSYELRLEILVKAEGQVSTLNLKDSGIIALQEQDEVLWTILEEMKNALVLRINGREMLPFKEDAHFVTVNNNGVFLKTRAVPELLSDSIIGVSFVYAGDEGIDILEIDWKNFPEGQDRIKGKMALSWGNRPFLLNRDIPFYWENPLEQDLMPGLSELKTEAFSLPIFSVLCIVLALGSLFFAINRKTLQYQLLFALFVMAGFLLYPVGRYSLNSSVSIQGLDEERVSTVLDVLLENMYRSFDVRDDSQVYDRLALSVSGDFLQDVFLQNRKAMVLEERGGARARIDSLEVLDVRNTRKRGGTIKAEAEWTVSGSVSHFGHTHYRKNRYRGIVEIRIHEDTWKLYDINLISEERDF